MRRPIRIGLIAEGETELGSSVPYIKPDEEGGKVIPLDREGALHTLIRRELIEVGYPNCEFVQRHPSLEERTRVLTGHTVLNPQHIARIVVNWQPDEIDMVVICLDSNDHITRRREKLGRAIETARANHFDAQDRPIPDRSEGGLAIKNFDTWLLADTETVSALLAVRLPQLPEDLESLPGRNDRSAKIILGQAIGHSRYLPHNEPQRRLKICWYLALRVDLGHLKSRYSQGYGAFAEKLHTAAQAVVTALGEQPSA